MPLSAEVRKSILPSTPILLKLAAEIAFPDGSMKPAGLRREAVRGRLNVSRIAGKDYTTLEDVSEMVKACRLQKASASGSDPPEKDTPPPTSSETETGKKARDAELARLREPMNS